MVFLCGVLQPIQNIFMSDYILTLKSICIMEKIRTKLNKPTQIIKIWQKVVIEAACNKKLFLIHQFQSSIFHIFCESSTQFRDKSPGFRKHRNYHHVSYFNRCSGHGDLNFSLFYCETGVNCTNERYSA